MMEQITPRRNNMLTHKQMHQLCKWVEDNVNDLYGHPYKVIANKSTMAIGFNVSEDNIRSVKEITELNIGQIPKKPVSAERMNTHHDLRCVARELEKLMISLGYSVSPRLTQISRLDEGK